MPALTLVSLLEKYLLETAMPRGDIRIRPSVHLLSMLSTAHAHGLDSWTIDRMTVIVLSTDGVPLASNSDMKSLKLIISYCII
jgi:hypothetical protein